jgi:hypothetical protein
MSSSFALCTRTTNGGRARGQLLTTGLLVAADLGDPPAKEALLGLGAGEFQRPFESPAGFIGSAEASQ